MSITWNGRLRLLSCLRLYELTCEWTVPADVKNIEDTVTTNK